MIAFLEQHWLSIFSLVVAVIGGVPGTLSLVSYLRSSAKLAVKPANFVLGNIQFLPDKTEYSLIFFSLTVTNEGEKTLTPAVFDLAIKKGRRWIQLERKLIPENIQFPSQAQRIEVREPWKRDLQRYSGTIAHGIPLSGFLLFVTSKLTLEELHSMDPVTFRFECTDVLDKKHRVTYTHKGGQLLTDTVYPKHGMSVGIKDD